MSTWELSPSSLGETAEASRSQATQGEMGLTIKHRPLAVIVLMLSLSGTLIYICDLPPHQMPTID